MAKKKKKNIDEVQENTSTSVDNTLVQNDNDVVVENIEVQNVEVQVVELQSEENSNVVEAPEEKQRMESSEEPSEVPQEALIYDKQEILQSLEALIFASPKPLSLQRIKRLLQSMNYDTQSVKEYLEELIEQYQDKGFQLVKVAQAYQFRTHPKQVDVVQKIVEEKPTRLSKSALEVLAIVAYKQPVTRSDLDAVRGIDSGHLLRGLLEKNLIKMTVGLAFVGLLLTSLLWFATSTMYDPCLETQECDTFQNVGYFSITDNEAVATLNDLKIPDPFSPRGLLDVQFINRGAVWPGMASYYTIIAERKELYGPYVLKKTLFSTEYFFESIFTMSLLLSLISLFVCLLIFLQRKLKLGRLSR
jgi:segregation and condensation protein B